MSQPELIRDSIRITETVLDTTSEQPVELDCLLPDYYPGIFKLLKTTVTPSVQSARIAGSQLIFDGNAEIRVLYLAEDTSQPACIVQNLPFSKTMELAGECTEPEIRIIPRCYYISGRAVGQRRLDIRGGISCKIKVTAQRDQPVITGGSGAGLQLHLRRQSLCGPRKIGEKCFTVGETLELGTAKPPFGSLLHSSAAVLSTETRLIANKAVCKGEIRLHLLYMPDGGEGSPEQMEYSLPVSQIVDLPGVSDQDSCSVRFTVTSLNLIPENEGEDARRRITCEIGITAGCTADCSHDVIFADDAYSTLWETELSSASAACGRLLPDNLFPFITRHTLESSTPISSVTDVLAVPGEYSTRMEDGKLLLNGTLDFSVLCTGTDGSYFMLEKSLPFESELLTISEAEAISFDPQLLVLSCSCTLPSDRSLELRTELRAAGPVYSMERFPIVTDIALREDAPRPRDSLCALRICYGEAGDSIWDIAKSHFTSMTAVLEENHLEEERLNSRTMLLLPLIDG